MKLIFRAWHHSLPASCGPTLIAVMSDLRLLWPWRVRRAGFGKSHPPGYGGAEEGRGPG
jgi:hypothetical protein